MQNRPTHRRYYDRYFDVPKPEYSKRKPIRGNQAIQTETNGSR